ncbi:MAG: FAD binding domain-containing protein [Eubacteriales bacterium]
MFTADNYVLAESIEQAHQLNQAKNATIVGGMLWLKMSKKHYKTVIDLSELGLNKIEENEQEFSIGCMVTLRQLELHEGLNKVFDHCFTKAVEHIVGVQFRNGATIGGSVYGRYGFSDILTMLMVLDTYVELYEGGIVSLSEFAKQPYDNDILLRIIVKKEDLKVSYMTQRLSETDFPILACGVSKNVDGYKIAIGARPKKAVLAESKLSLDATKEEVMTESKRIAESLRFESNLRGSKEYRKRLCEVLISRSIEELTGGTYEN